MPNPSTIAADEEFEIVDLDQELTEKDDIIKALQADQDLDRQLIRDLFKENEQIKAAAVAFLAKNEEFWAAEVAADQLADEAAESEITLRELVGL